MNLNKLLWASTAIVALASCQTASDPYMTLETKSLSLEVDGGTATVKLFTNVYYRVNNDCTDDAGNYWARITDTEVDGDATTFHIKYDANEKSVVRTGTVRFIGDGVTPLKLTLNQKAVAPKGINPNFVELPFTENTTTFTVLDEREWTAECEDKGVVISPASGKGVTNVKVTLPENSTISGRKINVNVAIKGDQTYTFAIDQKKYVGILADWAFKESLSETQKTFADSEDQSVFPGTNGKYVAASTGEGKLEYYAVERTGYSVAAGSPLIIPSASASDVGSKNPLIPTIPFQSVPCIKAKPNIKKKILPSTKSIIFFIRILPVFLARVRPASHKAKPACIKNTNAAPIKNHTPKMLSVITDNMLSVIPFLLFSYSLL